MSDSFVQISPDGLGKKIDNTQLTVGANDVQRQRINLADPADAAGLASVVNAAPTTQYGMVVWTSQLPALVGGKVPVDSSGSSVTVSGTVTIGSGTITVGAGTADIGKVRFSTPATSALSSASVSVNSSGDNTLIAGVGGQTIRVYRLVLVFAAGVNATFKDGAASALSGAMPMSTGGSITLDFAGEPWYVTSAANAFILNLSAGVQVSGTIWYTQS